MAQFLSTKGKEKRDFKLTVIVLTMDRPHSLPRLLKSIANTDFESDEDYFDIEVHVDYPKTPGLHWKECVELVFTSLLHYKVVTTISIHIRTSDTIIFDNT